MDSALSLYNDPGLYSYWVHSQQQRIWSLSCSATSFFIDMDRTKQYLTDDVQRDLLNFIRVGLLVLLAPLGFVFFIREKRGAI